MVTESITRLIDATRQGDRNAVDRLFRAVYSELKVIARSQRRRLAGNDTINTTALPKTASDSASAPTSSAIFQRPMRR